MWQKAPPVHHGTLKKGVRPGIRVPLFHTPTMCLNTDTFQAHREDLPAGLNGVLTHTLSPSPLPGYNFFLL